jgi:hypothetical protein
MQMKEQMVAFKKQICEIEALICRFLNDPINKVQQLTRLSRKAAPLRESEIEER